MTKIEKIKDEGFGGLLMVAVICLIAIVSIIVGLVLHQSNSSRGKDSFVKSARTPEADINKSSSQVVVVNKGRSLAADYVPGDLINPSIPLVGNAANDNMKLRREAAEALTLMAEAARKEKLELSLTSGYRSHATQALLYSQNVIAEGQEEADKSSARAGHSEHQTGLAADVEPLSGECRLAECFGGTPEGVWVSAHAHEYGFVVRYQKDKSQITGYGYEPWHLRYVGKELALKLYAGGQTMEEYFGLAFYTDYPAAPYQLR